MTATKRNPLIGVAPVTAVTVTSCTGGTGGTTSQDDTDHLDAATGIAASTLFLEQMMMHHPGVITMAQTELDRDKNAGAKDVATSIVSTRTDEISVIKDQLASF